MSLSIPAAICFVVCHEGPADHFATFAQKLSEQNQSVAIYASGPALKKLQERNITIAESFSLDTLSKEEENILAAQIARACATARVVITDVGHTFDIKVQQALKQFAPHTRRLAYYDNPERYVPGKYSDTATAVMLAAQGILFANANLTKNTAFQAQNHLVNLENRPRIGIGYYPVEQADSIAQRRLEEKAVLRIRLLESAGLTDTGQKILVYFGGNNEVYFNAAFPAFLNLLQDGMHTSDFSKLVIVLQQHPGAKHRNTDGSLFEDWINLYGWLPNAPKMLISSSNTEDAQVLADLALYYQTSMGPQFALAMIPSAQIGHETYYDILERNHLSPSITTSEGLRDLFNSLNQETGTMPKDLILENLGIKVDWAERLYTAIGLDSKESAPSTKNPF